MKHQRFTPEKRTALDGKTWWVAYDWENHKYSTLTCHGKYRTKRECQFWIDYYNKEWNLTA